MPAPRPGSVEERLTQALSELADVQLELHGERLRRQEAESLFESVLRSMSDAVLLADARGRIRRVNPAAEAMLGRAATVLAGTDVQDVLGEGVPATAWEMLEGESEARPEGFEATLRRGRGDEVPVSMSYAVFRDVDGKVAGTLYAARDLTETQLLYAERDRIARTLQQSLLPPRLPRVPGFEVAARFHPAGDGTEIGGDFYDLFPLGDGSWAIVIGDVCGKGAAAAAATALLRYTIRANAIRERDPARVLELLNEALLQQRNGSDFSTVAMARLQPVDGRGRFQIATGGHPPPLVVRGRGAVEVPGTVAPLLGVTPDAVFPEEAAELGPGDAIVFYTDGVTEAGAPSRILSIEELAALLRPLAGAGAEAVVEHLETVALSAREGHPRDDVAIVALALEDSAGQPAPDSETSEISVRSWEPSAAARELRARLAQLEPLLGADALVDVSLVATELIANAFKHGRAGIDGPVSVTVRLVGDALRVEVRDAGPGFEVGRARPAADRLSGWGLYIVDQLAQRWGADARDGARVWAELSLPVRASPAESG